MTVFAGWHVHLEYTKAHRERNQMLWIDKVEWLKEISARAAQASTHGDLKTLHQLINLLAPKPRATRNFLHVKEVAAEGLNEGRHQEIDRLVFEPQEELNIKAAHLQDITKAETVKDEWPIKTEELEHAPWWQEAAPTNLTEEQIGFFCDSRARAALRKIGLGKAVAPWSPPPEAARLLADELAGPLAEVWRQTLRQLKWPRQWLTDLTVWLPKPMKDTTNMNGWRDIHLMDVFAKATSGMIPEALAPFILMLVSAVEYGFLPGRSTTLATVHVALICERLVKAKVTFAVFFGDRAKAFQTTRHDRLVKCMQDKLEEPALHATAAIRHDKIGCVMQEPTGEFSIVRPTQGIITGDRLGPMAFLLDNHDYLQQLWAAQGFHEAVKERDIYPKGWMDWSSEQGGLIPVGGPGQETPIGSITYADDGAEIIVFKGLSDVQEGVEIIADTIADAGGELSRTKSELQIQLRGRGANKTRTSLEEHGLQCGDGPPPSTWEA
jgi:hypothetical protein